MELRPIPGFERYAATACGRIVNLQTQHELKPSRCSNGYLAVTLMPQRKAQRVHRLVALAWVEGFAVGLDVNHKNGQRTDNRAANLEWIDRSGNVKHS